MIVRPKKPWAAKLYVPPSPFGKEPCSDTERAELEAWLKKRKTKEWRFKTEAQVDSFIERYPFSMRGIVMSKCESLGVIY